MRACEPVCEEKEMITLGTKLTPHNNHYTAVQAKPLLQTAPATDVFFGQRKTIDRDKVKEAFYTVWRKARALERWAIHV